jgi:hypothetical protein
MGFSTGVPFRLKFTAKNFMPRAGPKRPKKYKLTDDIPIEEFVDAWFEILARPGVAKTVKALADANGISLDVMMCEAVADKYHEREKPLPPQLREIYSEASRHPGGSAQNPSYLRP